MKVEYIIHNLYNNHLDVFNKIKKLLNTYEHVYIIYEYGKYYCKLNINENVSFIRSFNYDTNQYINLHKHCLNTTFDFKFFIKIDQSDMKYFIEENINSIPKSNISVDKFITNIKDTWSDDAIKNNIHIFTYSCGMIAKECHTIEEFIDISDRWADIFYKEDENCELMTRFAKVMGN